jgi:membrane fusion protein (multidrug efflux system)
MDEQRTNQPVQNAPPPQESGSRKGFWKKPPVIVIGIVVLGALFYFGLRHLVLSFTHETTDNAFLEGDIVSIAPKVSGQVKAVHVNDNQPVKAGDLLLEIDPRDYEIQLVQKKSAVAASRANEELVKASFDLLTAQVTTAEATAKQSEAEVASDKAKADWAQADLKRAEDLMQQKTISPREFDSAKAAADAAVATLKATQQKAASDQSKVVGAKAQLEAGRKAYERAQAQGAESEADVSQAEQNLSYARITAPADGRITRKAVQGGDYVQVGQKLMALVLNDLWVVANFKETQLKKIRTNQPVVISVDSIDGKTFSGHVQSIQAGSGAAFSLLPPENAVGNYVKIVQRVPVKIVFDKPLEVEHVLGPGMSVVPSVHTSGFEVSAVVIAIVSGVLALVIGVLWWRVATRTDETNGG